MTTDSTQTLDNDHNVYVLGAGFSVDAGLPVIVNFMDRMRDAAAALEGDAGRDREVRAINRVLQFRLRASAAAYRIPLNADNVEELFSLAAASGDDTLAQDMIIAIAATLDYARAARESGHDRPFAVGRLRVGPWTAPRNWRIESPPGAGKDRSDTPIDWYSCPRYELYLGLMTGYFMPDQGHQRNTLITFNYDTVMEDALIDLGQAFSYRASEKTNIAWRTTRNNGFHAASARNSLRILKLHGSLNWIDGVQEDAPSLVSSYERSYQMELDRLNTIVVLDDFATVRKRDGVPLLLAPTWQKDFRGYLAPIWQDAVDSLKTATRIIVIGYSAPATDQHFKYLLAAGLQDNISLRKVLFVDPALGGADAEKSDLFLRMKGLFRAEHFDRGVIECIPMRAGDFLTQTDIARNELILARFVGRSMSQKFWASLIRI
jgi:hypothetical protein